MLFAVVSLVVVAFLAWRIVGIMLLKPPTKEELDAADALITKHLASSRVLMVSKTTCPFCTRAKRLLTSLNIEFTTIELNTRSDGVAIQASLMQRTGQRTVPFVFVGGVLVGGCDDLVELHSKGGLVPMVADAKVVA
ncbi:hypothetical protein HDU98_008341 [Podochytrium sp. JEL0797]|nr:hypothetical protein HDU98_008341 [Podochytrium sp. JEL0797]